MAYGFIIAANHHHCDDESVIESAAQRSLCGCAMLLVHSHLRECVFSFHVGLPLKIIWRVLYYILSIAH